MPNLFELLDLDPDLPWEPAGREQYERNLEAKRAQWANLRNAPGKIGADATRYYNLVRDGSIEAIMRDDARRNMQAQERRQALADKRNRLQGALAKWKEGASSVTRGQITSWSQRFEIGIPEVERMVKEASLTVTAGASAHPRQRLDPIILKRVRDHLEALRHLDPRNPDRYVNLYTLLGVAPDDSGDLSVRAKERNKQLQQNMNKTPALTKEIELVGDAMTIFTPSTSPDARDTRKLYDEALRLEPLERLLGDMDVVTGGAAPQAGHVESYFQDAQSAGFDDEEIRAELENRAQQRKWGLIEMPRRLAQRPCPFCAESVPLGDNSCPRCGQLLMLDCPNCDKKGIAIDRAACPQCGFLTGQRSWIVGLVGDAREAAEQRQIDRAMALLAEARRLWSPKTPDALAHTIDDVDDQIRQHQREQLAERTQRQLNAAHRAIVDADFVTARGVLDNAKRSWIPDNPEADTLTVRIRELDEQLAPHEREIQEQKRKEAEEERKRQYAVAQVVRQIEESIRLRDLFAARTRLVSLSSADHKRSEVVSIAQILQRELDRADEQFHRASGAVSAQDRIRLYHAALDICADHPDALRLLKASRPPAPDNVRLQISGNGGETIVNVTWTAPAEQRVMYSVVRKAGFAPVSMTDGTFIPCETPDRHAIDRRPPRGVELYYAVFTIRTRVDVTSEPGLAPEPIVLAEDVRDARAEARDGAIKLTWELPAHARALIVRKEGTPPQAHDDGALVHSSDAHSALDVGLINGTTYYYGIYCQYPRGVISCGVQVSASPHVRPEAPPPLTISGHLTSVGWCDVELRWGDDSKHTHRDIGRKVIYRIDPTPLFHKGTEVNERDLQPFIWRTIELRNEHGQDQLSQPEVVTYAPAVVVGESIVCGEPQTFRFIPELEQVEAHGVIGAVRVAWQWPAHVSAAALTVEKRPSAEYSSEDAARRAGAILVTRGEHGTSDRGQYDLPSPSRRRLRLTIAPVIRSGGRLITGAPVDLDGEAAEMAVVTYEFLKAGPFSRSPHHTLLLRVRNRGPLTTMPSLVVRFKEGKGPQDKMDGEPWWTYAEQPLPTPDVRLSLPGLPRQQAGSVLYGGVFLSDDALDPGVQLVGAGPNKVRLT